MYVLQMKYYPKDVYYENRNGVNYIILDYGDTKVEHVIAAQHRVQADKPNVWVSSGTTTTIKDGANISLT